MQVHDGIIVDKNMREINKVINELKEARYNIEIEAIFTDYLNVNIKYLDKNTFELIQPQIIQQIMEDLEVMKKHCTSPQIPAKSSRFLQRFRNSKSYDKNRHHRSLIGELNFLEKSTRLDIAYAAHQCARFSSDPKIELVEAIEYIIAYLSVIEDKGIIMQPTSEYMLEVYNDEDFVGNWTAKHDVSTAKLGTEFFITFAKFLILWTSKLQTQMALRCMALSSSLREFISSMDLIEELILKNIIQIL